MFVCDDFWQHVKKTLYQVHDYDCFIVDGTISLSEKQNGN